MNVCLILCAVQKIVKSQALSLSDETDYIQVVTMTDGSHVQNQSTLEVYGKLIVNFGTVKAIKFSPSLPIRSFSMWTPKTNLFK